MLMARNDEDGATAQESDSLLLEVEQMVNRMLGHTDLRVRLTRDRPPACESFPLRSSGETIGYASYTGEENSASKGLLAAMTEFLASGLILAELRQKDERARFDLTALIRALERLADQLGGLEIEAFLSAATLAAMRVLEADCGALFVFDEGVAKCEVDLLVDFVDDEAFRFQGRRVSDIAQKSSGVLVLQDSSPPDDGKGGGQPRSIILCPWRKSGGVGGYLFLGNPRHAARSDLRQTGFKLITHLIGSALQLHHARIREARIEASKREIEVAAEIQMNLLPTDPILRADVQISGRLAPCAELSGDFFDYFIRDDGRIACVIGDATGHGVGPSTIALSARSFVRAFLSASDDLSLCFHRLNNMLEEHLSLEQSITAILALYRPTDGTLTYVNAGHNPAMVLRHNRRADDEFMSPTGIPLGMFRGQEYPRRSILLAPDDRVLFYTDGTIESENSAGDEFGVERLRECTDGVTSGFIPDVLLAVLAASASFREMTPRTDDETLMMLHAKALGDVRDGM